MRITINLTYLLLTMMNDENNSGEFHTPATAFGEDGHAPEGWGYDGAGHGTEGGYYIREFTGI